MAEKNLEDVFLRRVLGCVTERKRTLEEIRGMYLQLFPQGRIAKVLAPPIPPIKIGYALRDLLDQGYISKEVTRFTDRALKEDTPVYFLSDKGRSYLLKSKKR